MNPYKAGVTSLSVLIDKFILGAYGTYGSKAETDDGISGVRSIPDKDTESSGLYVKNEQLYGMLHQLERELWEFIEHWEKLYRKGL